jgi:hypothetical protein
VYPPAQKLVVEVGSVANIAASQIFVWVNRVARRSVIETPMAKAAVGWYLSLGYANDR